MNVRFLEMFVPLGLAVAALIHLLPVPGVLGAGILQSAYGLGDIDPVSELLLQHRATMFAAFALLLLAAIVQPTLRFAAISVVIVSDLSFIGLCLLAEELNAELLRVAVADAASVLVLILALIAAHRLARVSGHRL